MNKFRKDERGSSLVMTIIAATFISLLAVAVISMTVTNIKLKQAQKQRGALLVMNLVIIALCLILFWGTIHMFRQLNDAFSRPAKTNWMENNVQSKNYACLVVNYHEDMVYGGLLSGTKKECYGVARYFEAASMYKAFLQTGDTERAAREKEKMDAAYEEMGDWNIAADSIRERLGLD